MTANLPRLSDPESAAVMVMLLDERQAAGLLGQLEPAELRLLGEKMCALGEVGSEAITTAITGFVAASDRPGLPTHGRIDRVRGLMTEAVGAVKAGNLMQRIRPDAPSAAPALELARWLTADALLALISGEHPQVIAVLLVQIEPEVAAEVLHGLADKEQTEVVHRIATLGAVAPDALTVLEDLLARRIGDLHGPAALNMGGPGEAAAIINSAGKAVEKRVMPELARIDKALARTIESEMFKFEHLFALDPQAMGSLLREVESEVLIDALKGIDEAQREVFFSAMSSRAADGVKDEIASRGRLKLAEVADAQRHIVTAARRLAAEGVIAFGAGGDDEYV